MLFLNSTAKVTEEQGLRPFDGHWKTEGISCIPVKDLHSQLHEAAGMAGNGIEIALYQDALQFLESVIYELGWNERPELMGEQDAEKASTE